MICKIKESFLYFFVSVLKVSNLYEVHRHGVSHPEILVIMLNQVIPACLPYLARSLHFDKFVSIMVYQVAFMISLQTLGRGVTTNKGSLEGVNMA